MCKLEEEGEAVCFYGWIHKQLSSNPPYDEQYHSSTGSANKREKCVRELFSKLTDDTETNLCFENENKPSGRHFHRSSIK